MTYETGRHYEEDGTDNETLDLVIAMRDLAARRDRNELSEPEYDAARRKRLRPDVAGRAD